jgi:hypothetical protein
LDHWNDDAVHGFWYELEWIDLYEPPLFETSLDLAFVITNDSEPVNNPPNPPSQPNGPSTGNVGEWLTYSTSATDPDGDQILYGCDIHYDGIIDHWSTSYYPSGATYSLNIKFDTPGTYHIRFIAKDVYGALSSWSNPKIVTITTANNPPATPTTPTGPSSGTINNAYTFQTSTTDPDGDDIQYGWDWNGDGTVDSWTGSYSSGAICSASYTWTSAGTYAIKVKARDIYGAESGWSSTKTVTISSNNAPNKPSISGPSSGRTGKSYTFTSTATDPDGDNIYYWFDWGDGTNSGWVGSYLSGQTASESHIWASQGMYSIKVKTKDSNGAESVWSDPLSISIPKSKEKPIMILLYDIIEQFITNHPYIFSFLQQYIG